MDSNSPLHWLSVRFPFPPISAFPLSYTRLHLAEQLQEMKKLLILLTAGLLTAGLLTSPLALGSEADRAETQSAVASKVPIEAYAV